MKRIKLNNDPVIGILAISLRDSHLIGYKVPAKKGGLFFGTIAKLDTGKYICCSIGVNSTFEKQPIFNNISEAVKYIRQVGGEVFTFETMSDITTFFSLRLEPISCTPVFLSYEDMHGINPELLCDENFIGVEWENSYARGFVIKLSKNKYSATPIGNCNYTKILTQKTIQEVLTHSNVEKAFSFDSRADLVKWLESEPNINQNIY